MFERILVPVDGSSTSAAGLKTALKVAKASGGTVCLIHVVEEHIFLVAYTSDAYLDQLFKKLRKTGKKILARSAILAKSEGVKAETVLVEAPRGRRVADLIVQHARKFRADVIIIGTHGRRGLQRVVMGSDAEQVVRTAPVPVLLVRSPGRWKG